MEKDFQSRISDLLSHAKLLDEACHRFFDTQKLDEVKNIGVRLRVLVGVGNGSGLLFALAKETGDRFPVVALSQWGSMDISEIENGTGKVLQKVTKKALITSLFGRLPVVINPGSPGALYGTADLQEWIENGFLLDWDVPQPGGGTANVRFTPQLLINRYAGQEAAHADATHGTFGGPIEALTMEYQGRDRTIIVPVVYEFLAQIGKAVAHAAIAFADKHQVKAASV